MKIYFPQYYTQKARFLAYTVIFNALQARGHSCVNIRHGADIAIFSICDATEYPALVRMRKETEGIPLIVGGAFSFNFYSAILSCDVVWLGEVYDFADCQSLDEIKQSSHSYLGGSDLPMASQRIEWDEVSVCKISPGKAYYWGGVGCKNKCQFCYTSWTHRHQANEKQNIQGAKETAKKNKIHLMISSNEYDFDVGAKTHDMLLRDYVKIPVNANCIRCGIEFANEETRQKIGKPISDNDIFHALQKAKQEKVILRFFHIAGYNTVAEWDEYINKLCSMLEQVQSEKLLHLMFNNLQYQNFTPLYAQRKNINPANYIDFKKTKSWYDFLRQHTKSVLVGAPSPFQHVACRMGVELAREKKQLSFWLKMMANPKKLSTNAAYKALFDSGVLDTPAYAVDMQTGKIKQMEQWT